MDNISVIGAGTMGNGIAHVFAQHGHQVQLVDISSDALNTALSTIEYNLNRIIKKGHLTEDQATATLSRIKTTTELEEAVREADFVIEAATENKSLKMKIFSNIDQAAPDKAILASNTSSISITEIAAATERADKVIGMHFFNPVPVMKLVEVIRGYNTSDITTKRVMELSESLGKTPVEVKDYPGFVANRILMPMINEAICALQQGVGGVQEIDGVMTLGMAHPMGPLQLADFVGLDVCLNICKVLQEGLGDNKYAPNPLLVNMVNAGKLGRKTGEGFYKYQEGSKNMEVSERFS